MQQTDVEIKEKPEFEGGTIVYDRTVSEQRIVVVDYKERRAMYVNGIEFDYLEAGALQGSVFRGRELLDQRKAKK